MLLLASYSSIHPEYWGPGIILDQNECDTSVFGNKRLFCNVSFIWPGQPTKVEFHVTVMSLDSINEGSMVSTHAKNACSDYFSYLHFTDLRRGYFLRSVLGRSQTEAPSQHDLGVPAAASRVARKVAQDFNNLNFSWLESRGESVEKFGWKICSIEKPQWVYGCRKEVGNFPRHLNPDR